MSRVAVILVPENDDEEIVLSSNDVSYVKIIQALKGMQQILSQKMVADAEKIVGKDPKKVEKYLDDQIRIQNLHSQQRAKNKGIGGFKLN